MMKHDLIATRGFTYATRRLKAGDTFEANTRDARVLVAIRRAKYAAEEAASHPATKKAATKAGPKKEAAAKTPPAPDEITMLRAEYERVFGKRPFMGWKEDELRERIADANADAGKD